LLFGPWYPPGSESAQVAHRSTKLSRWGVLGLALASLACTGVSEVPATPNLAELQGGYDQPSATLDKERVRELVDMYPDIKTLAGGLQSMRLAEAGVDQASAQNQASTGDGVDLQGSLRITVRCPGELGQPVYDENVNGSIELTVAVDRTRILRGISGQATRCSARTAVYGLPFRVLLDGPFALDLGRDVGIGQSAAARLLVSLQGQISVNDISFSSITGRMTGDAFESLFVLAGGDTVVLNVGTDGSVGVRDRTGNWHCATNSLECDHD
jgi:hypothetical protein